MVEDSSGAPRQLRAHPRAPVELRVEYQKLNAFFADYTRDISKGGIFIRTDKPLPIGTRYLFKLTVPQRPQPFELLGEVVWTSTDADDCGMGIRFIYADDAQRRDFESTVERLMVRHLGPELTERLLHEKAGDP